MRSILTKLGRGCGPLALVAGLCSATVLDARELDPELRQYVIASCSGDAYRLCPQSLGNEKEAVSCMRSKRRELGPTCRVAYDKVVHTLAQ